MSPGQGEEQQPPPHSAVDVQHHHGGDYQHIRDHDDDRAADMDLAIIMFRSLTIITFCAAVLCMIVNLVSLIHSFRWNIDTFLGILRIYAVIFAGFIAVAETEWEWLFRHWPYLEYWFGRGMLQIFVAVMTKALTFATYFDFEVVINNIAAYVLLSCGVVYSLAGVCCMRKLKRRKIQKKNWREQAVRDLEDLDKRRRDLQGMLAAGA